jgi:hypothetical protein
MSKFTSGFDQTFANGGARARSAGLAKPGPKFDLNSLGKGGALSADQMKALSKHLAEQTSHGHTCQRQEKKKENNGAGGGRDWGQRKAVSKPKAKNVTTVRVGAAPRRAVAAIDCVASRKNGGKLLGTNAARAAIRAFADAEPP